MPPFALVAAAVAAVLGTLAATADALPFDVRATVGAGLLALCAFALSGSRTSPQFRALVFVTLGLATVNALLHVRARPQIVEQRTAQYRAVVLDRSEAGMTVATDPEGLRVLARVREPAPPIGATVLLRGRLAPFDDARNPGEPSESALQRDRGLDARLEAATVLSFQGGSALEPRAWLSRAHEWAHAQLAARVGEPGASVVAGELWGERSSLPPDLRTEFQETGTIHVLVTAGLHVGAVAALGLGLFTLFALPRAVTCALAIALIWTFVWWSGGALPGVRAASMASAALVARACGRATFSWNALAVAALSIAFGRPESVASASFALSFSCVGAIFACAGPMEQWLSARFVLPNSVREALVVSLATQCGTWPVTAAVFLQFTPYAVLANLAVVPCVAATMALGSAQLVMTWLPPLAQAAANANAWLIAWMLGAVHTFAAF
ncbi:MAG: ComEC/Rec2 family competence protein, partial [Candidatus Eremiobacteraeota bacterium]|nr:ComEC/Rec2 family competence protein [Candidatus Eremiobacteraeota bacterium]